MARYLLGRVHVGISGFLGVLLTVVAANAAALGLGEIELDSALNEELDATIELLDVGGLAQNEILVSLASSEDFERVGVERFFFLTDLDFEVVLDSQGNARVAVSTSRPVTEPYLNFIVQVMWPNGRLLKEFTLLLDPPTFSQAAAPAVAAPVESERVAASTGRVQRESRPSGTRVQMAPPSEPAPQPSPLDQDVVGDEYRMTDRSDTLWGIASRTRPSSRVSVQQNMLAIQRLNPDAFIDGNINLLKAGYTLKLPDEATATTMSQDQALAAVERQNEAWRSGVSLAAEPAAAPAESAQLAADTTSQRQSPVDATAPSAAAPAAAPTGGELRIVAGEGDSATGRADAAPGPDVAAVLEENDRLSREIEELSYQREADQEIVTNQLAVKDRQLEVRDQQIAELQQRLAELEAERSATPEPAQTQTQNQNTTASNWWENPLILYGGAGVLVLALVGAMLAARRRRDTEEDFYQESAAFTAAEEDQDSDAGLAEAAAGADADYDDAEPSTDEPGEELPDSETSDVIGEADIYIAYGRYPQAIGLLLGVLEDDPARNDVRLKLLELYSETNDREAFNQHLAALVENCEDEDALMSARELESRFGEGAVSLDEVLAGDTDDAESNLDEELPSDALDLDDAAAKFAGSDAAEGLDTEIDITAEADDEIADLDISVDGDEAADLDINADVEDEEAGFELELDEPEAAEAGDEEEIKGSADLGGDLGIDFDPDRDIDQSADADGDELEPATAEIEDEDRIDLKDMGIGVNLDSVGADGAASETNAQPDSDLALAEEDEFDFEEEGDSANTKLDLARAYIDMGDADGARDILKEVVDEGNAEQKQQAQEMLDSL